jgi:16S rRNA (cytidine1402-2'-O)-methyltransferase
MERAASGKLFLVPAPLGEDVLFTLPEYVREVATKVRYWVVEDVRTTRRLLKAIDRSVDIDSIQFWEWDKHQKGVPRLHELFDLAKAGHDIGLMSEAGCPGVADPGSIVVRRAHELGITVAPMIGPNAILLALMASGLNGQYFAFRGYLPIEPASRRLRLRDLELEMQKTSQTQLFIETPYRNNPLMADMLSTLHQDTLLCIAANLTTPNEMVRTLPVKAWKKNTPDLHKQPCIFVIGK